ncbi:hypothetical protein A2335_02675 [Candidatus Peregrinibacteria bacterium RIFOXYB2_FULL_32_7]|nr:MAG: hypothetical protein A2335_02675 [Candidatus Peregrinibacteria bacterium RIFOXYB2_FULL_32_7]
MPINNFLLNAINIFFQILSFAIIARVIISWLRTPISGPIMKILIDTTEPILDLAKKITPRIGMLDFSAVVALIGLDVIRWILISILAS